jgi:hypothetical protein
MKLFKGEPILVTKKRCISVDNDYCAYIGINMYICRYIVKHEMIP